MSAQPLHPWNLDPSEAAALQKDLRGRLSLAWEGHEISTIGGVDIGLVGDQARAAIVTLQYPSLEPIAGVTAEAPLEFPYVPGLLAFREGPAILAAWERLETRPDVVMFDGQGIAHPRGMGIAAHMGLWLDRPTIGVAKSWLYGLYEEPGPNPGDFSPLRDPRQPAVAIGAVLRTRAKVKPLFVSPGHKIDIATSVQLVMACVAGYRLPETTRWAHRAAGGETLPVGNGKQGKLFG